MSNDPWNDLASPAAADAINARRVDAALTWDFFWARSIDNRCLLVLQHAADSTPHGHIPNLKGIEVSIADSDKNGNRMLILKLLDSAHKDIFHKLCCDIVACSSDAKSEREAVEIALARTWRWHHLLRGGNDGRLSAEEQKGLIGELLVLEHYLLPGISAHDAVSAWHGPLGAPKDFEIGRICIEAKTRCGASTPYISISSEHQLDNSGTDALFLCVIELDQALSSTNEGCSVSETAERLRNQISGIDDGAATTFESLLFSAGFRWEDDYSDSRWIEGTRRLYQVEGDFPRITSQIVESGVTNVKYTICLPACEQFQVMDSVLESALGESYGS